MSAPTSSTGIDARLASMLCYSVWWVTGLLFLVLERHDAVVRFHAAQSVVLFGGLSLVLVAAGGASAVTLLVSAPGYQALRLLADVVWAGAAVMWLVVVLRVWQGEVWRVPLVATLADGLAARTRS